MAVQHHDTSRAPRDDNSQRARLPVSSLQLQAYLLARETLRRLKGSPRPCFARNPSNPPNPPNDAGPPPHGP